MNEENCNCNEDGCSPDYSKIDTDDIRDLKDHDEISEDEWKCTLDYVDRVYSYDLRDPLDHELSASEALYGFFGWLSTRKKVTKISDKCDPGKICKLIERFIKANNLEHPRGGWAQYLIHPKR